MGTLYNRALFILRDLRMFYLFTFRPRYVIEQIKLRKGKCPKECMGNCCGECEYLKKDRRCSVYKKRFQHCRDDPFDRFDKRILERLVGRCALYWD